MRTFIRVSSSPRFVDGAVSPEDARKLLSRACAQAEHVFWPDDVDWLTDEARRPPYIVGHRQMTDAFLVTLPRRRDGRLATLDRGVATLLRPDGVDDRLMLTDVD